MRQFFTWEIEIFPKFHGLAGTGLLLAVSLPAQAARVGKAPPARRLVEVATVVTVLGSKSAPPPLIHKDDVNVYEGRVHRDVLYWLPARGDRADLQLAIVIDEADSRTIDNQIEQVRKFILAQPKTTSIGIYYANSGGIRAASQLNPDHKAVAKALRLPTGALGNFDSVYHSLSQLMSGWPATGARREILVISEGFDPFNPGLNSAAEDAAATVAQRDGIIIYPLFVNAAGRFASFASSGLDHLSQLASATGGHLFFLGMGTPPSFQPYLSQLDKILRNQYFLVWKTPPPRKKTGQLRSFKVRFEETDIRVSVANEVFVPALH